MTLFSSLILRDLATHRIRAVTAVVGIALGIAVVLAVRLAASSAVRGFERAVESLAGRASLEIAQSALGVDESRLSALAWLQEVGSATPVIEGEAVWKSPGGTQEMLRVLGVDILTDQAFRDYAFADTGGEGARSTREVLGLLTDPRAVVLTQKFAAPRGIRVGDTILLEMGDRAHALRVRALLADEGPARAMDGHVVLMDIAAAQWALNRLGFVDRLEVRLPDGADIAAAERDLAQRLGGEFSVQRPARRGAQVETMLAAFHANLTALSTIALVVGMFLVYNTVSTSVLTRRHEIGILRAVGTSRRTVFALFMGEALALAAPGCALGLLLGRLLADGAVALTAATVQAIYVAAAAAPPSLDAGMVLLAFGLGIPLSLVAAVAPAGEAARTPPVVAMRGAGDLVPDRRRRRWYVAAGSFAAAGWLCTVEPINGLPVAGYLAAFLIVVGTAAMTAPVLAWSATALERLFRRVFVLEGWLATGNLRASARRLSISVAALAVSLAMTVAIAVMVSSFRETVIYWVEQTLLADLFVGPASRRAGSQESTVPADVERIVRAHPGVAAVDSFRAMSVPFADSRIFIASGDLAIALGHGRLLFKAPRDAAAAVRAAAGTDAAVVSEAFALRYGRTVGDSVTLPTRDGPHRFRIAAVYYDYSNDRGTVVLDRPLFERYFDDRRPTGLTLYLEPEADIAAVRADLAKQFGADHRMSIHTNRSLRAEVLRIFDSTFAITWALEVVAVAVAVMGIIATLVTLVFERRRELSMLRLLGASRLQVVRMVVAEAAVLGGVSQAIGLAVGLALSLILIYVINVQSFGWSIQFHFPAAFLAQLSIVVVAATALAGVYPANTAARAFLTERGADE